MLWVAIAAFPVMALALASGISPVPALRPLGVAILVGAVFFGVVALVLRDRHKAGVGAVLGYVALFIWPRTEVLLLTAALLGLVVVVFPRLLRVPFPWALATPAGNALAVALTVVVLGRGLLAGQFSRVPADVASALGVRASPVLDTPVDAPDIFVLLLEDYPRADTLRRVFGFDNGPFLAGLEARGFTVAPRSRSNYSNSQLTLLTMYQARHIEEIPELEPLRAHATDQQYPLLRALTEDGPVFDVLRRAGYSVTTTSPGYEQLTIRTADRFVDGGQITDLEAALVRESALGAIGDAMLLDILGQQHRSRVRDSLSFFADALRSDDPGPRFVFAHVPAPHPPVAFGPAGEALRVPFGDPYWAESKDPESFRAAYVGQLQYLDLLVLDTLDAVAAAPRPQVVVVMSDEGYGQLLDPDPEMRSVDSVATLFAAHAPEGAALFPAWITPVNLFPIVLDRYVGADLPMKQNRNYVSISTAPFDGRDIPNGDAPPGT